ncbi:MAG: hypothetical protein JST26_09430 [Bacteroidetes bacterium]|nr:hypothetical protein [Bacteroidota bacterium]
MNRKRINSIYIATTLSLVILASVLVYYFSSGQAKQKTYSGYTVTFPGGHTCWDDLTEIKKSGDYRDFKLTADSVGNDSVLKVMGDYTRALKNAGDSLHGVHLEFTDDMPYRFYLKAIAIFKEYPSMSFIPFENQVYAINKRNQGHMVFPLDQESPGSEPLEME